MAKRMITVHGLEDVVKDFDRIISDVEPESKSAITESLIIIENQMKNNARSTFTDGYTQGVMVESISHKIEVNDGHISASVGVYDMSNKTGSSDRKISGRHISEPLIAHFYETGIRPHSTAYGARLAHESRRGKESGQDRGGMHRGTEGSPVPFLSTAFDLHSAGIFDNIVDKLNKSIDKK